VENEDSRGFVRTGTQAIAFKDWPTGKTPLLVVGPTGNTPEPSPGGRSLLGRAVISTRPSFFTPLILHVIAPEVCERLHRSRLFTFCYSQIFLLKNCANSRHFYCLSLPAFRGVN